MSAKIKNKTLYDSYYCYDNTIVFHFYLNKPDYWCEKGLESITNYIKRLNIIVDYFNNNLKNREDVAFRFGEDGDYIEISCIMTDIEHKEWMKTKKKEQKQEQNRQRKHELKLLKELKNKYESRTN